MGLHGCIGLFYVIEGFLDILLPAPRKENGSEQPNRSSTEVGSAQTRDENLKSKLLFTVKPGGIAGYLGELDEIKFRSPVLLSLISFSLQHDILR